MRFYGFWNVSVDNPETRSRRSNRGSRSRGGGGGGGIISTITPTVTAGTTQSQTWDSITAGSNAIFTVAGSGIPVSEIRFTAVQDLKDFELTLTAFNETPSGVSGSYEGVIYRYFNLTGSNVRGVPVSSVVIAFSVNRSFLSENNASVDDVILLQHAYGQWYGFETLSTGSDAENLLLRS